MVLELIVIGGAVYYYLKKNKQQKAKRAAFLANQPWVNRDGSVTYPPGYPGLPPYTPVDANNYSRQIPIEGGDHAQHGYYSHNVPAAVSNNEKTPLVVETREIVNEKH